MTSLLTRQDYVPGSDSSYPESAAPNTITVGSDWCPRCYRTGRGRHQYVLASECWRHAAGTPASPRAQALARARAERGAAFNADAHALARHHKLGRGRARALGRPRARQRAITARTHRPDGRFRLPTSWRRRLEGLRQPTTQKQALALFETYVELADRRCDRAEGERAAFRVLVLRADWRTMTSCATRERMAAAAGVHVDTISRYLAAWRDAGLVRVVVTPLAPAHAAGRGRYAGAGRAPVYGLTYTPELSWHTTWWEQAPDPDPTPESSIVDNWADGPVDNLPDPASNVSFPQVNSVVDRSADPTHLGVIPRSSSALTLFVHTGKSDKQDQRWPSRCVPVRRDDRRLVARQLAADAGWLGRVVLDDLDAELASWWACGWCPAALTWALDHYPDGTTRIHTDRVRHPVAWVAYRLQPWLDPAGRPVTPPVAGVTHFEASQRATSSHAKRNSS